MISCGNIECKYRNKRGHCTHKHLELSSWSVHTVNMGVKDFLECKSFEYDEEYMKLGEKMKELGIIDKAPWGELEGKSNDN